MASIISSTASSSSDRIAVFPIRVPPLRERSEDVLPLAEHFLALHGRREAKPGCRLTPEATRVLLAHAWPGNVRELENEMQRALALSEPGDEIPAGAPHPARAGGVRRRPSARRPRARHS